MCGADSGSLDNTHAHPDYGDDQQSGQTHCITITH